MSLFLFTLLFIIIGSVCLVVITENKNPVSTTAWLIVIIFLPVLGLILYILLGRNYKKNKLYQKLFDDHAFPEVQSVTHAKRPELDIRTADLERFIYRSCYHPASYNNHTRFYFSGEEWIKQLLEDIKQANAHIHLEFFIWKADATGTLLRDVLLEKADQGVKVRLLLDRIGSWSISYFHRDFLKPLFEHPDVAIGWVYPTRVPFIQTKVNYRNHRKIVVIDGRVGYSGGMNVGDEYVAGGKFPSWRDAQFRVQGDATYSLQMVFLTDWYTATREDLFETSFFPVIEEAGKRGVQIVPGGPDQKWESIAQSYFRMINEAREELLISTPYLIPDEAILMSLKTAALRGVEVKILVPEKPDHIFVYWASSSYFYELLEAGIKIYAYQRGFMHAKIMICDNLVASVGSANLDLRSMYINFEINALWYSKEDILLLRARFYRDLRYSRAIKLQEVASQPGWVRFRNSVARLFSPLI